MSNRSESEALHTYWKQQVEAWQQSGQSQRAFCHAQDLDYYRFGYWSKKFRSAASSKLAGHAPSGFVAVVPEGVRPDEALSLRLPNGAVLQGIRADNVATVCQLLAHLS